MSESVHVHWRHSCPTIPSLVDSTADDRLTLSELVFFALMGLFFIFLNCGIIRLSSSYLAPLCLTLEAQKVS